MLNYLSSERNIHVVVMIFCTTQFNIQHLSFYIIYIN